MLYVFFTFRKFYVAHVFYSVFSIYIFFSSISVNSLGEHAMRVYKALSSFELEKARKKLSLMVSRDTGEMGEEKIITFTIESVSENFVDGILSPMFYFFLGIVGVAFYKIVNTLDSMVGYRNDKYEKFGKFSAIVDDVLNFIPARVSVVFISLASFFVGYGG